MDAQFVDEMQARVDALLESSGPSVICTGLESDMSKLFEHREVVTALWGQVEAMMGTIASIHTLGLTMYRQLAEGPLDDIKRAALRSNTDNTIQLAFGWNCQFQELALAVRAKLAKVNAIRNKMDNVLTRRGH